MHSIDVTEENFQTEVLEKSKSVPVVVDFWAEWCQPCQILKPVMEALAEEYAGKFILAKVNADTSQNLAAQFGVRGIPSIKAVYGGKIVNEFSGVLPEEDIRKFLDQLVPNESELLRQDAIEKREAGDIESAMQLLDKAIEKDENNYTAQIDKAELCVDNKDMESATSLLKKIPLAISESDPRVKELQAKIDLSSRLADLPDRQTLLANVDSNPSDLKSRLNLANLLMAEQDYPAALEQLFEIIQQDRHFADDIARKTILEIFTLMGPQDDRVREARRKLARLLN